MNGDMPETLEAQSRHAFVFSVEPDDILPPKFAANEGPAASANTSFSSQANSSFGSANNSMTFSDLQAASGSETGTCAPESIGLL